MTQPDLFTPSAVTPKKVILSPMKNKSRGFDTYESIVGELKRRGVEVGRLVTDEGLNFRCSSVRGHLYRIYPELNTKGYLHGSVVSSGSNMTVILFSRYHNESNHETEGFAKSI